MKAPDTKALVAAHPTTFWGYVVQMTPIVMTVLATALAGLSSGEMTESMYNRSLAGQHQAKAADQWSFYQSKRLRMTSLNGTVTLMRSLAHVQPCDAQTLAADLSATLSQWQRVASLGTASQEYPNSPTAQFSAWMKQAADSKLFSMLGGTALPAPDLSPLPTDHSCDDMRHALDLMPKQRTEEELAELVRNISPKRVQEITAIAEHNSAAFSAACEPINGAIAQLRGFLATVPAGAGDDTKSLADLKAAIEVASMDYEARRLDRESQFNRTVAALYELQVARSGV